MNLNRYVSPYQNKSLVYGPLFGTLIFLGYLLVTYGTHLEFHGAFLSDYLGALGFFAVFSIEEFILSVIFATLTVTIFLLRKESPGKVLLATLINGALSLPLAFLAIVIAATLYFCGTLVILYIEFLFGEIYKVG